MNLYSTNHQSPDVNLQTAVMRGLAPDKGLYMPDRIPQLPSEFFDTIHQLSLPEIAYRVAHPLLKDEVPDHIIKQIVTDALDFPVPLVQVEPNIHTLELFHGPTMAFKDFGARFMARLMGYFISQQKNANHQPLTILVATSGDTGSAVAAGFLKVPSIEVIILYPKGKVSHIQEQQLTTMGHNITALEIDGVFDDCQAMVKQAFVDPKLKTQYNLSSANSINIARLIPQAFYYFHAFAQIAASYKPGKRLPLVISVPSGNFGNLTAGLIAKRMGLPVSQFIASTNINKVVPEYLQTGIFTAHPSHQTISNAMDVGNPSNFPRLLELYKPNSPPDKGGVGGATFKNSEMSPDSHKSSSSEQKRTLSKLKQDLTGYSFTDDQTAQTIREVHQNHQYLLDPHGAVGYLGLKQYLSTQNQSTIGVFLETAHPAKFADVVEPIIGDSVTIPNQLQAYLNQTKQSHNLPNQYSAFQEFLLGKKSN